MNNKRLFALIIFVTSILFKAPNVFSQAQVSPCQLPKPDQDTLRIFPERTNYRTEFIRIDEEGYKRGVGGENLYRELERRLGDKWDPVWEPRDIPYVFYEVLKGSERLGWIFGANQGWPGSDNCQIMCRFDLDDRIVEFYYQKLPFAINLRSAIKARIESKEFYSQFIGLTLAHFYVHEQMGNLQAKEDDILALDMISRIKDTSGIEKEGFLKTLRGLKMIFILVDDFKFGNRVKKEEVFAKTKYLLENKNKVPLLGPDALIEIRKIFPDASRYVVDLISLKGKFPLIEERLGEKLNSHSEAEDTVYPVYVVYKDEVYQDPFVRGVILGYVLPFGFDTQQGKMVANIAVRADNDKKGKIAYFKANDFEFPGLQGLSLVNFYTTEALLKIDAIDEKLDKISKLGRLNANGEDVTVPVLRAAKKGLIIIDEFYFHNYFNKNEITQEINEYWNNQGKGGNNE